MKNYLLWGKRLLPFIGIIIFVILLYYVGIDEIIDELRKISLMYILLSAVLIFPMMLIRNYAWQLVLREQQIQLGFYQSFKILFIGYFYGMITPGYLGQVAKVLYLKDYTNERSGKLFVNVLIETLLRTFSLYLVIIVGAILVVSYFPELLPFTLVWVALMVLILWYFIKQERGERLFHWLILHLTPRKTRGSLTRFANTFYQDFPRIRRLVIPFVLGMVSWVIIFTQEYLFVIALDLPIPYFSFLLLYPIANVAGYIPITFSGIGIREFTAIAIFPTLFAVSDDAIFAVAILGFFITDILIGFIGFLIALTETRSTSLSLL